MALHNSGGIAELPVAVTDLANSLNSIAAMSGMKYCHIPPHATPYDAGGGSGGGPGVSQLIPYPATVNGVMSFPAPRGPLQSPAVFSQMQTASGPPTAAAAASPAGGNGGADLTSFNTAVVGGPTGPGNTAPPNGLESPHSSVTGATTMVLSQSSARGVHLMQQQFPPPQRIVQASATMIESGYYVSPCWAPAGQPAPQQQQQQQQQFDETGQLVGLNASAVSNCGPGMPTTNRRIVQQPPPIPNPGLAAPPTATLDPRYVPPNLPHASPHPMYHSVNNICIPPTQPAYLMHDAGAPLNHDLANFGPLGPPGLSPTSGQPRLFMSSAAAQSAAQFRLSMDPRSAVAALHLRPSGAACCFPVSGVGNNVSGAGAGGPMPTVDPSGLRPPFGSESLVSTPPRKAAAEPRKKRAKATKNPAGKQRNTARTNRGATAAAAAAAQATAAAAASVQKRLSESEAPRVTPPPPQPPPPSSSLIGSPVMLTSQSSMPLPTSKPSPPMGGDWMRINSVPPPTSLACTPSAKPAPPPPPNSYLQNPNPSPSPYTSVAPPVNYLSANGTAACNTPSDTCPPPVQLINAHAATAAAPVPVSTSSTEERLVCPITNGNLWGPAVLEMDEEQSHRSPNGLQVRSFEFEINADYLDTIVKRLDLDIVVCSHLSSEPLQVCHWPDEAVNIRFNGTLLNLDRSTSVDGQPAHKVCCVKNLCRAGRNTLEFILSARNGLSMSANPNFQAPSGNTGVGSGLKSHEFAAFMVHMPAFNALLEGLQRRQPAAPSLLCQLILSSWNSRHPSSPVDPNQPSIQPVIAEISLICPVFRTRMQVPGRIVGCQHVDMFDMEAYLHREAVWPRLACPICGNKSPAGINGLSIDASLIHTMALAPKSATSIQVRSDGFWRLTPPLAWQLPPSVDQWQPIVGPHTYTFSLALQVGAVRVADPPPGPHPQQQQQQQQQSFIGKQTKRTFDDVAQSESKFPTGADGETVTPAKRFGSHASPVPPAFSSTLPPSSVGSQAGHSPSVNGPSSVHLQAEMTPPREKWNAETTPQQNSPIPPNHNCTPEQRRVASAGCTPVSRSVAGQSVQQQQQFGVPGRDGEHAAAPCPTSVARRNSASTPSTEAGAPSYAPSPSKPAAGLGCSELLTAPLSQKSTTDYLSPCGTPHTGCAASLNNNISCTAASHYPVNNSYFSTSAPSLRETSETGTASQFAKPPPPQLPSNPASRGVASVDSTDSFMPPPPPSRPSHSEVPNTSEASSISDSLCNQVLDPSKLSTSGSLTNGASDKVNCFSDSHDASKSSTDVSKDSSGNTDPQKSAGEEFKACRSAPSLTAPPSHVELHFLINTLPESLLECALERTQSLDSFLQTDYLNYVMGL